MAASAVARTRAMASFLTIALVGFSLASAQSVSPSNATLPASESASETVLHLVGGPLFSQTNYNIAPLTASAGKGGSPTVVAVSQYKNAGIPYGTLLIELSAGNQPCGDAEASRLYKCRQCFPQRYRFHQLRSKWLEYRLFNSGWNGRKCHT